MARVELLTVGEAFEDLVFLHLPRLPAVGEEVRTARFQRTYGGGAMITAVAAARLGTRACVASALADGAVQRLQREGVAVDNVRRAHEAHAVTAALSIEGERSFVTFDGDARDQLEGRLSDALASHEARHVHFAFRPHACARWVATLEALRTRGVGTSWDFGFDDALAAERDFAALAASVDYLFLNAREARLYAGVAELDTAVAHWRSHARNTVIKCGADGARWVSPSVDLASPARAMDHVLDTTGAGDAFNGGFLHARIAGKNPRESLATGNAVGALSTRAAGGLDALPRPDELT